MIGSVDVLGWVRECEGFELGEEGVEVRVLGMGGRSDDEEGVQGGEEGEVMLQLQGEGSVGI